MEKSENNCKIFFSFHYVSFRHGIQVVRLDSKHFTLEQSSDPTIRYMLIADLLICFLTELYPMKNGIISVSSSNSWMRTSVETNCAFRCLTASLSMSVCFSDWYRMTSRVCCPQTLDSCDLCTFSLPFHCKRTLCRAVNGFSVSFYPLLFTPRSLNTEIPSCD